MTRLTVGADVDTPHGRGTIAHLRPVERWSQAHRRMDRWWMVVVELEDGERRTFTTRELVEHARASS